MDDVGDIHRISVEKRRKTGEPTIRDRESASAVGPPRPPPPALITIPDDMQIVEEEEEAAGDDATPWLSAGPHRENTPPLYEAVTDAQPLAPTPSELAREAILYGTEHNYIPNTYPSTLVGISRNIGILFRHDARVRADNIPPPIAGPLDVEQDMQLDYMTTPSRYTTRRARIMFVHSALPVFPDTVPGSHLPRFDIHDPTFFAHAYSSNQKPAVDHPTIVLAVIPTEHSIEPGKRWLAMFRYYDYLTSESRWYVADPAGEHADSISPEAAEETAAFRQTLREHLRIADAQLVYTKDREPNKKRDMTTVVTFIELYRGLEGPSARVRTNNDIPDVALGALGAIAVAWELADTLEEIATWVETTSFRYIQAGALIRRVTLDSKNRGLDLLDALMQCIAPPLLVELRSDAAVSFSAL